MSFGILGIRREGESESEAELRGPHDFVWSNDNARAMLQLIGLPASEHLEGEAPVAEVRRAILRARAGFDRFGPSLVRPTVRVPIGRKRPDGTIEIRAGYTNHGLDLTGLEERLDMFAAAVEALASLGATHIAWGKGPCRVLR